MDSGLIICHGWFSNQHKDKIARPILTEDRQFLIHTSHTHNRVHIRRVTTGENIATLDSFWIDNIVTDIRFINDTCSLNLIYFSSRIVHDVDLNPNIVYGDSYEMTHDISAIYTADQKFEILKVVYRNVDDFSIRPAIQYISSLDSLTNNYLFDKNVLSIIFDFLPKN